LTDEAWQEVIQTNLNACFYCTSAVIPIMTAQSYGRIVNISSMNGQIAGVGQANYSASKGAIIAFTRTAAMELAHSGITVNSVSPGYTKPTCSPKCPRRFRLRLKPKFPWADSLSPRKLPKRGFSGRRRRLHHRTTN